MDDIIIDEIEDLFDGIEQVIDALNEPPEEGDEE